MPFILAPTRSSIPLVFSPATAASLLLEELVDGVLVSAQPLSSQIAAATMANIDKYFMSDAKRSRFRNFLHQKSLRPPQFAATGQFP